MFCEDRCTSCVRSFDTRIISSWTIKRVELSAVLRNGSSDLDMVCCLTCIVVIPTKAIDNFQMFIIVCLDSNFSIYLSLPPFPMHEHVHTQKELFLGKTFEPSSPRATATASGSGYTSTNNERKLSVASSSSMKTKWLKAFRSLKPTSGAQPADK